MAIPIKTRIDMDTSKLSSGVSRAKGKLGELKSMARGIGAAFGAMFAVKAVSSVFVAAMERQSKVAGLTAVSVENVSDQLERLKKLAKEPGLGMDQVITASTNLQAIGMSAEGAEGLIREMGNALALVGKGKADMDGVTLALTQIAAKGKISAEEINQMAERLPQIRSLMQKAFGTADTEVLNKMGISAEEFFQKITEAAKELPRAAITTQEHLNNMSDAFLEVKVAAGKAFAPIAEKLFPEISSSLQGLSEKMSEYSTTFDPIFKAFRMWAEHIKLVGNVFLTAMEGIGGAVAAVAGRDFKLLRDVIEETHAAIIDLSADSTKKMANIYLEKRVSVAESDTNKNKEKEGGAGSESRISVGRANRRDFVMSGLAAQEEAAMKAEADRKASEGQQYADYSSAIDSMLGRKGANEEALKGTAKFMGSADSLQRIGGGGGAVSSANPQIKKLEELIRQDKEGVAHLKYIRDNIGNGNTLG